MLDDDFMTKLAEELRPLGWYREGRSLEYTEEVRQKTLSLLREALGMSPQLTPTATLQEREAASLMETAWAVLLQLAGDEVEMLPFGVVGQMYQRWLRVVNEAAETALASVT